MQTSEPCCCTGHAPLFLQADGTYLKPHPTVCRGKKLAGTAAICTCGKKNTNLCVTSERVFSDWLATWCRLASVLRHFFPCCLSTSPRGHRVCTDRSSSLPAHLFRNMKICRLRSPHGVTRNIVLVPTGQKLKTSCPIYI